MNLSRMAVLSALVVAVCLLPFASGAGAAGDGANVLECGARVTEDVKLTKDLKNCPDNGLVVVADGVTIDLAGHTISGDGELRKDCPKETICDDGIVDRGHSDVTVEGGRITDFALGGLFTGGSGNHIDEVTSIGNQFGGLNVSSSDSVVENSIFAENGNQEFGPGVYLNHAANTVLAEDEFRANGQVGVFMQGAAGETVEYAEIVGNPTGAILEGSGAVLTSGSLEGNGEGVVVFGSGNRVIENSVEGPRCGEFDCRYGISLEGGSGNLIADNVVKAAYKADLRVGRLDSHLPTVDNRIVENDLSQGDFFGLLVEAGARRTSVRANVSQGNGLDGFAIQSRSTSLRGNFASGNKRYGFSAVTGVRNLGGNHSRGNGEVDCVNLRCAD